MKRAYKGFLLITTVLLLAGCQKKNSDQVSYRQDMANVKLLEMDEGKEFAGKDDISAILYMETDITEIDTCIVTSWENRMYASNLIPNRYIWMEEVVGEAETIETPLGNAYNYFYSTYTVNLYSIEEGKVVKTYAIEEMEEALPEGYRIYDNFGVRSFRKEGQDYLLFSVAEYQKKPKKPYERKCLTINVDTDEIKVWDDIKDFRELLEDSEEAQKYRNQLSIFQEWSQEKESGENQLLAANGFTYLSMETDMAKSGKKIFCTPLSLSGYKTSGVVELRIATDSLPEKNDALYQKFPGLEAYRGKKDLVVKIFLGNFPTSEEIFRLVIEDGQEISFEGCVMDGKYSKDGQMHEIGSFAEFEEWYQDPQK